MQLATDIDRSKPLNFLLYISELAMSLIKPLKSEKALLNTANKRYCRSQGAADIWTGAYKHGDNGIEKAPDS